jgi:hypothetical protein
MNRDIASVLTLAAVGAAATAAALAFAPTPAYADDITVVSTPFVSSRTRSDVRDELMRQPSVLKSGGGEWALQYSDAAQPRSGYTSAQARSDYKAARGEVNALTAEDSGSSYLSTMKFHPRDAAVMGAPAR